MAAPEEMRLRRGAHGAVGGRGGTGWSIDVAWVDVGRGPSSGALATCRRARMPRVAILCVAVLAIVIDVQLRSTAAPTFYHEHFSTLLRTYKSGGLLRPERDAAACRTAINPRCGRVAAAAC